MHGFDFKDIFVMIDRRGRHRRADRRLRRKCFDRCEDGVARRGALRHVQHVQGFSGRLRAGAGRQWRGSSCKTGNNRLRGGLPADWKVGDKTGNNGKDAAGDIAIAWPKSGGPVLVCAYTQGGSPTPQQFEAVFKEIGAMIGERLS